MSEITQTIGDQLGIEPEELTEEEYYQDCWPDAGGW